MTARERLAADIAMRDQAFPFPHRGDTGRAPQPKSLPQQRENTRIRQPAWETHAPWARQCIPRCFERAAPIRESCTTSRLQAPRPRLHHKQSRLVESLTKDFVTSLRTTCYQPQSGLAPLRKRGINLIARSLRAGEYFSEDRSADPAISKQS